MLIQKNKILNYTTNTTNFIGPNPLTMPFLLFHISVRAFTRPESPNLRLQVKVIEIENLFNVIKSVLMKFHIPCQQVKLFCSYKILKLFSNVCIQVLQYVSHKSCIQKKVARKIFHVDQNCCTKCPLKLLIVMELLFFRVQIEAWSKPAR